MSLPPSKGIILAAPGSASGKTTVTLGLLRALKRRGEMVWGAKSGPDYIDPQFHTAACGAQCFNLDAWAMSEDRIRAQVGLPGLGLIEGAMGLFDGAPPDGKGAVADLARMLDLPVVLVVDAGRMAQSAAPLVAGFAAHDPSVRVAAVILNKVGSVRHERMLRQALKPLGMDVLGAIPRDERLAIPSRHLGLVQAKERKDLDQFLNTAATIIAEAVNLDRLMSLAAPLPPYVEDRQPAPQASRTVAIASDTAFNFVYKHVFHDFVRAGWHVRPFSPLRNEPVPKCDLVFLPGGYPELHATTLADANNFMDSLRKASETTDIYGECGGYMVLGEYLTDADGTRHRMAGLLPLETSFAERRLHLGYRTLAGETPLPLAGPYSGHEFHYATTLRAEGPPLFEATDAEGNELPQMGLKKGRVSGSFAHVIDRAPQSA